MAFKLINATEAKSGTTVMIDGSACTIRSNDISKTGKHGHAKCRIEAIGIFDGKKKVLVVPGHERMEVPMIDKRKAQVLSVADKANVMDNESFETLEVDIDDSIKRDIKAENQIEYWDIEGRKIIKRILG